MVPRIALLSSLAALALIACVSDAEAQAGAVHETQRLVTEAYPVADLVIATPGGVAVLSLGNDIKMSFRSAESKPDFETLIEEITTTIEPGSWKDAGGVGIIAESEATLSLVVRQTRAVHDQIADLIHRMRRELDVQVTLEVRHLEVPEAFLESNEQLDIKDRTKFDEKAMKSLMMAVQSQSRANLLAAPKVTLFQGNALWLHESNDNDKSSLVLLPTISRDRRSVVLSVAATGKIEGQPGILGDKVRLKAGETFLLDRGLASQPAMRELLLITPRVIVAEEEEELLSLSAE